MDILQVKKEKETLAYCIKALIDKFEVDTGTCVSQIDIETIDEVNIYSAGKSYISAIHLTVEVK